MFCENGETKSNKTEENAVLTDDDAILSGDRLCSEVAIRVLSSKQKGKDFTCNYLQISKCSVLFLKAQRNISKSL